MVFWVDFPSSWYSVLDEMRLKSLRNQRSCAYSILRNASGRSMCTAKDELVNGVVHYTVSVMCTPPPAWISCDETELLSMAWKVCINRESLSVAPVSPVCSRSTIRDEVHPRSSESAGVIIILVNHGFMHLHSVDSQTRVLSFAGVTNLTMKSSDDLG